MNHYVEGKPYVFISYSHSSKDEIERDVDVLHNEHEVNVWYDQKLRPGMSWEDQAIEAIINEDCRAVLFYACANSIASENVLKELETAKKYLDPNDGEHIFPILLFEREKGKTMEETIKKMQRKMVSDNQFKKLEKIKTADKIKNLVLGEEILYLEYRDDVSHLNELVNKGLPRDVFIKPREDSQDKEERNKIVVRDENPLETDDDVTEDEVAEQAALELPQPLPAPPPQVPDSDAVEKPEPEAINNGDDMETPPTRKRGLGLSPVLGNKKGRGQDVKYTLYGKAYTESQVDMMLRFFAQVLKRHPGKVQETIGKPGLSNVSAVDYSLEENQTKEKGYKAQHRGGRYFSFENGESIYVGAGISLIAKQKAMSTLLKVCGESKAIFESEEFELSDVDIAPRQSERKSSKSTKDFLSD